MLKIRRPLGRLIFNMGIAIPGKTVFLIETAPRSQLGSSWWRHEIITLSVLLAHCEGNPWVNGGFASQRASDAERWCFLVCQRGQTVGRQVNWVVLVLFWRRCNDEILPFIPRLPTVSSSVHCLIQQFRSEQCWRKISIWFKPMHEMHSGNQGEDLLFG